MSSIFDTIPLACRTLDCEHTLEGIAANDEPLGPLYGDGGAHRIFYVSIPDGDSEAAPTGVVYWAAAVDGTRDPSFVLVEMDPTDPEPLTVQWENEHELGCLYGLLDTRSGKVVYEEDFRFVKEHLQGCFNWTPARISAEFGN